MTFDTQTISAIDALAMAGGLDPLRADPKGVFIFRDEIPEVASAILGGMQVVGDQRFVYILDLTQPMGMFNARDFKIRDGDTIFVTEAASVLWSRQIAAITGSLTSVTEARDTSAGIDPSCHPMRRAGAGCLPIAAGSGACPPARGASDAYWT
jgi:polysaccharide biosynthesis/export protein